MRSLDFESHFLRSRLKLVLSRLFFDDLDFVFCQDLPQLFEDNYETSRSEELRVFEFDGAFLVTLNLELLTLNFDLFQVSVDSSSMNWSLSYCICHIGFCILDHLAVDCFPNFGLSSLELVSNLFVRRDVCVAIPRMSLDICDSRSLQWVFRKH